MHIRGSSQRSYKNVYYEKKCVDLKIFCAKNECIYFFHKLSKAPSYLKAKVTRHPTSGLFQVFHDLAKERQSPGKVQERPKFLKVSMDKQVQSPWAICHSETGLMKVPCESWSGRLTGLGAGPRGCAGARAAGQMLLAAQSSRS